MVEILTGTDRSAGPSYNELLEQDSGNVPAYLKERSPMPPGTKKIPVDRYFSKEWHDKEVEHLWKRTWQMACLADEVSKPGDVYVYEIAHLSYLIVRTEENELKAFPNACLHRGRAIRDEGCSGAKVLRCHYHGWSWKLDGTLKEIPCQWDFPDLKTEEQNLSEISVDIWQGFVFINPDPDAEPLADFLDGIDPFFPPTHSFVNRRRDSWAQKIVKANWKVCMEAFSESYHLVATHPQLIETLGDTCSDKDVYKNFSRLNLAVGVPSPHLGEDLPKQPEDAKYFAKLRHPFTGHIYERVDPKNDNTASVHVTDHDGNISVFDHWGVWESGPMKNADKYMCKWIGGPTEPELTDLPLPPFYHGRKMGVEFLRAMQKMRWEDTIDIDSVCDSEILDTLSTNIFPNFQLVPFLDVVIRWRPNGDNPEECLFDFMRLNPHPNPTGEVQHAPATVLGDDDDWTQAPNMEDRAKVLQQDSLNMGHVQKGMKTLPRGEVLLSSYGESILRHFWELLEEKIGVEPAT